MAKNKIDEYLDRLKNLEGKIDNTQFKEHNSKEHEDKTRSELAKVFVYGYFILLGVTILLILISNFIVEIFKLDRSLIMSVKDVVLVLSSAIGSSLGFVVGYYFKSSENGKS